MHLLLFLFGVPRRPDLRSVQSELNALETALQSAELEPLENPLPGLEEADAADGALERRRFEENEVVDHLKACNEPLASNPCSAGYAAIVRWMDEIPCLADHGATADSAIAATGAPTVAVWRSLSTGSDGDVGAQGCIRRRKEV